MVPRKYRWGKDVGGLPGSTKNAKFSELLPKDLLGIRGFDTALQSAACVHLPMTHFSHGKDWLIRHLLDLIEAIGKLCSLNEI